MHLNKGKTTASADACSGCGMEIEKLDEGQHYVFCSLCGRQSCTECATIMADYKISFCPMCKGKLYDALKTKHFKL